MQRNTLTAALILGAATSAFGGGIVRDLNVSTAGHAAMSIGQALFSYNTSNTSDPGYIGAANPFLNSPFPTNRRPFQDTTGGSYFFGTNVAANPTNTSGYGTNNMPYMSWYMNTGASNGGRIAMDGVSNGPNVVESYVGNTATFTYNNIGLPAQLGGNLNAVLTIQLLDGTGANDALALMNMAITRTDAATTPLTFDVGNETDLDVGGLTAATVTSLASNAGYNFAVAGGLFGQVEAYGSSFSRTVGTRTNVNTALKSTAALNGTITGGTDTAAGFLWNDVTIFSGETKTFSVVIALNRVVPEPTVLGLATLAVPAMLRRRRA